MTCNLQLLQMPHFELLRALATQTGDYQIKSQSFEWETCGSQNPNPTNGCGIKSIKQTNKQTIDWFLNEREIWPLTIYTLNLLNQAVGETNTRNLTNDHSKYFMG